MLIAQRSAIGQKLLKGGLTTAEVNALLQQVKTLAPEITKAQNALQQCQSAAASAGSTPVIPQPILPDCSVIQKQITNLETAKTTLTKQLSSPLLTPQQKENIEQLLRMDNNQITDQELALKKCQQTAQASPTAPQRILEIAVQNPPFSSQYADWGKELVTGPDPSNTDTFPQSSGVAREWVQVLDPGNDYDNPIIGASGWAINPRSNTVDFPFDHPFQPDWESSLALDMNQNGTGPYTFLLSNGDKGTADHPDQLADESEAGARGFPTFNGLLGIEMDNGLVPAQFKQATMSGNRLAVFGRWIIDAGHNNYRAEIHPPLMMASASVTPANTTKALFTSRPFLVGSTYSLDPTTINVDNAPDDGDFFYHFAKEVGKAAGAPVLCPLPPAPCSTLVEAHVKVKSKPFSGHQVMHFLVRPPSGPTAIGGFAARLTVSFHFTVHPNVTVKVSSSASDTVDVVVTMDSGNYIAPPLPANPQHRYTPEELSTLNSEAGSAYSLADLAPAGLAILVPTFAIQTEIVDQILDRGIQGDQYVTQENAVDMLTQANAVQNADAANIPAGAGVIVDPSQPYPIAGWMEVKWSRPVLAPNRPVKKPAQPPAKPVQTPRPPVVKQ
ncbi:MAG TPA: hypothetical protein VKH81_05280 [Candidatus Angelobacter sp.]|nr:hypothetical protein [Candidatus Angelobacter sp.]